MVLGGDRRRVGRPARGDRRAGREIVRRARCEPRIEPSAEPIRRDSIDQALDSLRATTAPTAGSTCAVVGGGVGLIPAGVGDRAAAGARRARDVAGHVGGDGPWRHLRPDRRRLRPLLGRCHLERAALREDALRQRAARTGLSPWMAGVGGGAFPARVLRDARLGAARDARTRGWFLRRARRRLRGRRGEVLRVDRGRDPRRTRLGRARRPSPRLLPPAPVRARADPRGSRSRATAGSPGRDPAPAARGPIPPRPPRARRQAPDRLERAHDHGAGRSRRRARALGLPRGGGPLCRLRAARSPGRRWPTAAHLEGRARADRGYLEDYTFLLEALLGLYEASGAPAGLPRPAAWPTR